MKPPELRLRRAGTADAEAIRTLTREVYAKWVASIGREPRPMTADYRHAVRAHWIDLHEETHSLVALIEMIPHPDHLLVENIVVRESHQRQGIGEALLDHAAALARKQGLGELRLYTNAAFASNLQYYRDRGFAETGRAPLPNGGTMVHFAKPVS
jgi:N-acetylglutamate synthase-like GNAT family acetyltransferase